MWAWGQSTGKLYHNRVLVSRGYSGKGRGKNNPALENVRGVGPIPAGLWKMTAFYNSKNVGPAAIMLQSQDGTPDDFDSRTGRSAFRIHGDSIRAPGTASRGCIILPRAVRERMWKSGDHDLTVVP